MPPGTIDDEKRRIREVLQELNQRPRVRLAVPLVNAESLAVTAIFACKAADIHEHRRRCGGAIDLRLTDAPGGRDRHRSARQGPCQTGEASQEFPASGQRFHVKSTPKDTRCPPRFFALAKNAGALLLAFTIT